MTTSFKGEIPVLYECEDFLIVYKTAGLLVHRTAMDALETRFLVQILRDQCGQPVYPVHRLDKPTAGLLLVALNKATLARLSRLFETGAVNKHYEAVVRGFVEPRSGTIDYALKVEQDTAGISVKREAQTAVTHYEVQAQIELPFAVGRYETVRYSRVLLNPQTGRRHQLRRHMAHTRHPILGDTRHGDGMHNRFIRSQYGCHRLLLIAKGLQFTDPQNQKRVNVETDGDEEYRGVLAKLGLGYAHP